MYVVDTVYIRSNIHKITKTNQGHVHAKAKVISCSLYVSPCPTKHFVHSSQMTKELTYFCTPVNKHVFVPFEYMNDIINHAVFLLRDN